MSYAARICFAWEWTLCLVYIWKHFQSRNLYKKNSKSRKSNSKIPFKKTSAKKNSPLMRYKNQKYIYVKKYSSSVGYTLNELISQKTTPLVDVFSRKNVRRGASANFYKYISTFMTLNKNYHLQRIVLVVYAPAHFRIVWAYAFLTDHNLQLHPPYLRCCITMYGTYSIFLCTDNFK